MNIDSMSDMEENKVALIDQFIQKQQWEKVTEHLNENPEDAKGTATHSDSDGRRRLHWLCSMGSTPAYIVDLVASLDPDGIVVAENRFYGDTTIHIACRNSVVSSDKVDALLQHCPDPSNNLLIRNQFGGTALHSAANHNAVIEVLQLLVNTCPKILHVRTFQNFHAVSALWSSYKQTIPGVTLVARILRHGDVAAALESRHFVRFWERCCYLALATYKSKHHNITEAISSQHVLHGLIQCNAPFELFLLALKIDPSYALAADPDDNLPLHVVMNTRPYRFREADAVTALLEAAPDSYHHINAQGDVPLILAIRNRIPWSRGRLELLSGPMVVQRRDVETRLLPYQLAASIGGRVATETIFHLLLKQPDLLFS